MTHAEFNELMGFPMTTEDFDYANFLYMNAGEMTKQDFVKEFKKIGSSPLVNEFYYTLIQMNSIIDDKSHLISTLEDTYRADMLNLLNIIEENLHSYSVDMYNYIIGKVGHKTVIRYKITHCIELNDIDLDYIYNSLSK